MKSKNKSNISIGNPKYSEETNRKASEILRRAVNRAYPEKTEDERALMYIMLKTESSTKMDELYVLIEEGTAENLIELVIYMALKCP
jgi:5-methylcytosine-specific restriction endonuclease McrBC regulatory subunit McrC